MNSTHSIFDPVWDNDRSQFEAISLDGQLRIVGDVGAVRGFIMALSPYTNGFSVTATGDTGPVGLPDEIAPQNQG